MADPPVLNDAISLIASGNPLKLIEFRSPDCADCSNLSKKLYHCPLCDQKFRLRSRLKEHFSTVHWECRLTFGGKIFLFIYVLGDCFNKKALNI